MKDSLDDLFSFPVIMMGDEADINLYNKGEDPIRGVAEYPFFEFVGVIDRWIPKDEESIEKAKNGEFDACGVTFANIGTFIVPWTKEKFKFKYRKFVNTRPIPNATTEIKLSEEAQEKINEIIKQELDNGETDSE